MKRPIGLAGKRLTKIALDAIGAQDEAGLGVPGAGDGGMLPGGPGDRGSTAGDVNAGPAGSKDSLKQQIKDHFIGHAHTVLDDDQMEHTEKLEAMKELLAECEKILDAFIDEESQEPENQEEAEEPEEQGEEEQIPEDHDQGEEPEHEEGARGAAMDNAGTPEDTGTKIAKGALNIGASLIPGVGGAVAKGVSACLNNMPQIRQTLGPRDAQLAQLTSRLRRQEIHALWLSGKISPVQKKQLEDQFLAPQHVALSLSNETFGNSFDQAISLLASNESYGEQTGVQGGMDGEQLAGIALTNKYTQNQREIAQAEQDDQTFIKPWSN